MKWLLLILVLASVSFAEDKKCRILSFSSGIDKVPYQVGALKAIIERSNPEDVEYDVVSGVSFGALNAAIAAVHEKGKEKEMIEELESIWNNTAKMTVYQNWMGFQVQGILFKGGIWDNSPWETFLKNTINGRNASKALTLGAVNVATGEYTDLTEKMAQNQLHEAVYASSAVNIYFPPVTAFGQDWMDGSGVWPIEVIGPINRCLKKGFKESDIVVDVLMTYSDILPKRNATNDTTIPSAIRYFEIANFYSGINGLARAMAGFKQSTFKYCINPQNNPLPTSWFPLSFSQSTVNDLMKRGYDDAVKIMSDTSANSCHQMVHNFKLKKGLRTSTNSQDSPKSEIE